MDPITALAIQGGLAGAQALYGGYQQRRAKQGLAMMEDPLATTPAARLQMLNAAKDQTVANQALEEINRSLGTSVSALQNAGARASGALSGVQRAADAAKTNVLSRQQQRQDAAMAQFAKGEENDRFMRAQQAQRDRQNFQRAQAAGVQNIGNAAASLAAGIAQTDFSKGEKKDNNTTTVQLVQEQPGEVLTQTETENELKRRNPYVFAKKGGKAKKTPGAFSHKTNPLHIIADSGSKVGEMTGGEYIFNPKQAASLRKHSKSGSSPLHKFVRQMLSKSQFR
tara:strand:- start:6331 stop:7176 length:846 start_codon:yes stop_codon:yes gene_type:complete